MAYDTIRYDRLFALQIIQASCQLKLARKLKITKNVLNGTEKKIKQKMKKNQETDGYGRGQR